MSCAICCWRSRHDALAVVKAFLTKLERWLLAVIAAAVLLQLFFVLRIALMAWWAPQSTAFERTQLWQHWHTGVRSPWQQQWVDYENIAPALKKAVLTAEDDLFTEHDGVQWQAIERAWQRNQKALAQAEQKTTAKPVRIVGGSTITQQLAKNLLLSGERSLLRKGQELALAFLLEQFLDKRRILELYLNHAEWGQGIFGAEAAAQHYFKKPASRLTSLEAARLAVMLPRPRYFQQHWQSGYLNQRAQVIARRMAGTAIP